MASNLTIGFLHRLTSSGHSLGSLWAAISCAGLLAVHHANERDPAVIPQFARLRKSYRAASFNTDTTEQGAIAAYRGAVRAGAKGLVGPALSFTNVYVGHLGALDKLVNIGYWTSSPTLSNATTFPYLARTYHSDTVRAVRMVEALRLFGFVRFAVVNTDDAWANAMLQLIRAEAERPSSGVVLAASFSFDYNSAPSVRLAVRRAGAMSTPVSVFVALIFEVDIEAACDEAEAAGLLRPGVAWLEGHGLSSDPLETIAAANRSRVGACLHGWVQVASALPRDGYARLDGAWRRGADAQCASPGFTPPRGLFASSPPDLAVYEYDAAAAMILALDALSAADESDGDAVRRALARVAFNGSSGEIRFDGALDRAASTAEMVVNNVLFTDGAIEWRRVYTFSAAPPRLEDVAPLRWPGNTSAAPVDVSQLVPHHSRHFIGEGLASAAAALTAVAICMAAGAVVWTLRHRDAEAIKSAQPLFLVLIALGTIVSVCVAFPLSQDHRTHEPDNPPPGYPNTEVPPPSRGSFSALDAACSSVLWLYVIGFDLTWERRRRALARCCRTSVCSLLLVDTVLLVGIELDAPLFYKLTVVSRSPFGSITESHGECTTLLRVWPWLAVMIALHGGLLLYSTGLVYQLRTVPSEFNEGKYVSFSLLITLQTCVLALILLLLITDNPVIGFIIKWFVAYWCATVTLLMMFVPKMGAVHMREDDDYLIAVNRMRRSIRQRVSIIKLRTSDAVEKGPRSKGSCCSSNSDGYGSQL
ncbi:hypothetical protein AB1Y20_013560 [Prymnesium parvum]|uniref:G-protein coupled receptors family 3 profile domain-containing protein n=1 Tax=Prymnesium parvum TaxID=97485 RepID=A0AB34IFX6_PRYPA